LKTSFSIYFNFKPEAEKSCHTISGILVNFKKYGGAYELRYLNFRRDYPGKGGDWWEHTRTVLNPRSFINATFTVLYPDFYDTFTHSQSLFVGAKRAILLK